jgi:hypothetical protein
MRALALSIAVALLGAPASAVAAPSISLNGVNIDGVTSQRFENCTVVIDERGNVDIRAKGYAARTSGDEPGPAGAQPQQAGIARAPAASAAAPAAGPAGRVTRRYFIATEQTPPGPQFDLGIFINAQWIREVKSAEPSTVTEITKYLRPGPNKVTLAATKRIAGDRLSYSRDVTLKVVVGEGNVGGDHVMIDVPLVETARNAVEMDDRTEEYVIDAR